MGEHEHTGVYRSEIKVLLRAAISPLDKKMDHLTTEFAELKRSVEFLSKKYDEVISQLQVANNRISQQSTTLKNVQEELKVHLTQFFSLAKLKL